jgi:CubicO group peptidase (beta-lactamase class C family)
MTICKKRTLKTIFTISFLLTTMIFLNGGDLPSVSIATLESKIDYFINSLPDYQSFSGVIFISSGEKVLINKGYGLANHSFSIANTPDTKFWIGSFTKPFVAFLVMKLYEEGKLSPDDKIIKYLPDYPPEKANKISIHNLLNHTSGIPHHYIGVKDFFQKHDKYFYSTIELLDLISKVPLVHEPGEKVTYSSFNYSLLGIILERVSGKSFNELLKEKILTPLGMENTGVENNLTIKKRMASGYMRGLQGLVKAPHGEMSPYFAAGDMYSTARDISHFMKIIGPDSDRLLAKKYKELMMNRSYGYNVIRTKSPLGQSLTIIPFGGSAYGFQATAHRVLEKDWCIVVFCNIQAPFIVVDIIDKLGDFLLEQEPLGKHQLKKHIGDTNQSYKINPGALKPFTGWYKDDAENIFGIFLDADGLYRLMPGEFEVSKISLNAVNSNTFKLSANPQVQYHFKKHPVDNTYKLQIFYQGKENLSLSRVTDIKHLKLNEYTGRYCSSEIQNTITISNNKNRLFITEFLGQNDVQLTPLSRDLFGYPGGCILFQRSEKNRITGFILKKPDIDGFFGAKFIKK